MKTLTVITTTYNREYCLKQLYDSLVGQPCKDFIWLIIDDGSTDNTKSIVEKWKRENVIEIEYHYKPNGGMHTARNYAYQMVSTELNTIIDSDDWMAPNAVEKIISFWNENKKDEYAGIIALNCDTSGHILGTRLPHGIKSCSYKDFWKKYKMKGDKKLVYRSELTKLFPYPEFEGEKFYPASYKFYQIDKKYDMLLLNETICVVDYSDNSMTRDKYSQYKTCAFSFMHYRKEMIKLNLGIKSNIKNMIHYVMETSIAKCKFDREILKNPLFFLCFIPGKLFHAYLKNTNRKY